jgi:SAM-dependent methyltransferase
MLREVWRVLAAGGRLLLIVPNRRGLWARMDTTPFGHGRPYSRAQLLELLREALFTPVGWSEALWVPPFARTSFLRTAVAWERLGRTFALPFAGVHIVEATKQVWRPVTARPIRRLKPMLAPTLPEPAGI